MAMKWNIFSGRDNKKEPVRREEHTMTEQDIRNMVTREVNAASVKKQVINYMEDVSAQGVRTEALLNEIKDAIDLSMYRIEEVSNKSGLAPEKMEEIEKSINRVEQLGEEIKNSVHKDNLLTYKNIKILIEEAEADNKGRARAVKRGINAIVIMTGLTLAIAVAGAVFIALKYFNVI